MSNFEQNHGNGEPSHEEELTQDDVFPIESPDDQLEAIHSVAQEWATEALVDPVTGLGNRRALERDLSVYPRPQAVLKIDGDNVGLVNKYHGDDRGDTAIRALGDFIRESVRPKDHVYRTGGDEFVVVYGEADSTDHEEATSEVPTQHSEHRQIHKDIAPQDLLPIVTERAERQLAAFLSRPENEDLLGLNFGISIGGALWRDGMANIQALMDEADAHMQRVKLENMPQLPRRQHLIGWLASKAFKAAGLDPTLFGKYNRAGYFKRRKDN